MSEDMHAVITQNFGSCEQLTLKKTRIPELKAKEVLIQVGAAGVNRADCLMRSGHYPDYTLDQVLGLEVAGQIVACGNAVKKWKIGERVCALLSRGGYAEYCVADENLALPLPTGWSYEMGAALIENYLTAHATLWDLAKLKKGEKVLIHAIASGVGLAACQLALLEKCIVCGTSRSVSKIKFLSHLPLFLIQSQQGNFLEQLPSQIANEVDVILDSVGGEYFPQNLKILKLKGRLIQIAMMAGAKSAINLAAVVLKRLKIYGFVLRSQSLAEKQKLLASFYKKWQKSLENGEIKPQIDSVFSFNEVVSAHKKMEANENCGKIVLKWK